MSKTSGPPSKRVLDINGIKFVPSNSYAPKHWAVKHFVFSFDEFDTSKEYDAKRKAALANQISISLENNGRLHEKEILIPAIFRLLGFK